MTDTAKPESSFDRDRALDALDKVRAAITDDDLQTAITQVDALEQHLNDWKREDARRCLDEALGGDLLAFNQEAARKCLEQWASSLSDGEEDEQLADYRERVEERGRQKQNDLQVRGVTAHCEELWQQASDLERSNQPPHPDFVVANYYDKARDVVAAARAENSESTGVEELLQRAERLRRNKLAAGSIYKTALEFELYADALDDLAALEEIDLIPRYHVTNDGASTVSDAIEFDRMIPLSEAREEIERLGRTWAADRVKQVTHSMEDALSTHRPRAALDVLADRAKYERFVEDATRKKLRDLEQRASEELRLLEQAERRARQALQLVEENPIGAWDVYSEAFQTYAGAPSLADVRETVVTRLATQLEELVAQAETAFNEKRMRRISQIYQSARLDYGEKDEVLDALLARLEEVDWQARTYLEYLQNATGIVEQIREVVWEDVASAGELLAQLEEYPDIVLEDVEGLTEVRATVRRRLNDEVVYNQLYKLLLSDNMEEVERGISTADDYPGEERFQELGTVLKMHRLYLAAQREYAAGRVDQALPLLERVAAQAGHPDRDAAAGLVDRIRAERTNGESDEETG